MLKHFYFNIMVIAFVLSNIFIACSANAYNITVIKNGVWDYNLRGNISASDLNRVVKPYATSGINFSYNSKNLPSAAYYGDWGRTCSSSKDIAALTINDVMNKITLRKGNINSLFDNSVTINCQIKNTSPVTFWTFKGMVSNPEPDLVKCNVSVPQQVNFGTISFGDNNHSIAKVIVINCDKDATMALTVQGDNETNSLTLSGTTIKFGFDRYIQSRDYKIIGNLANVIYLNFTVTDTGNTPGIKKGYILLLNEIE